MTNNSLSVVTILYNAQLMRYIGIDGVSAYGIMMYIGFIFVGVYIGYAVGSAPIIGFHYGAKNREELKNVFRKSMGILCLLGVIMTAISVVFAGMLSSVFVQKGSELWSLTAKGLRIYSLSFLLCGLNIFGSSFFTALSNGALSLLISFFRTFLCQAIAVLLMPIFFGVNGIWSSVVVAELASLVLTVILWITQRKRYGYA